MTADTASATIERPASVVFDFMSDPQNLDLWSFGTWHTEIDDSGLVLGRSMGDGKAIYVRIQPHPGQLLIDYLIGVDASALAPRIFARAIEGPAFGGNNGHCMLLMTALRGDGMSDERWSGLCATHAVELRLIKSLIESGYDHRRRPAR